MPKVVYSNDLILKKSCELAEKIGIVNLNVRIIAKEIGCSVAPIYTAFDNYENLENEIINYYLNILLKYTSESATEDSFLNIGAGVLKFTFEYPKIFMDYFNLDILSNKNSVDSDHMDIMEKSYLSEFFDKEQLRVLLEDMSIFTSGLCLTIVSSNEKEPYEYYLNKIQKVGEEIVIGLLYKNNKIEDYKRKYGDVCKFENGGKE